jgi:hypothetical protein
MARGDLLESFVLKGMVKHGFHRQSTGSIRILISSDAEAEVYSQAIVYEVAESIHLQPANLGLTSSA